MNDLNDIFQVDYKPNKRELHINLPKELWDKIDSLTLTRHFEKIKKILIFNRESEAEQDGQSNTRAWRNT